MRILNIRLAPPGPSDALARFDAEIGPDLRLYNLKLSGGERGHRVYPPSAFGSSTATFSPELRARLVEAALAALGDQTHGRTQH
ncbi:hypothetical protein ACLBXM_02690 [Xanthobacteraceae bacterium A53D]